MRTVDLARAALCHPNTVRLYEQWGFLAPASRGENGYRRWTEDHLDQMVFARKALDGFWPGRPIRVSALALVRLAATGDLSAARGAALAHLDLVRRERSRAEQASAALDAWALSAARVRSPRPRGAADDVESPLLSARGAAELTEVSPGRLRNWERNGLVVPLRDEKTGRRIYRESDIGRIRIIRTLLLAGYSLMAVRRMTAELDDGRVSALSAVLDAPREDEDVLTAFDKWRSFLASQEDRAAELLSLLAARMEKRARRA